MVGTRELGLVAGVAVFFLGLVLPMWGFFRLGAMHALERRRQSAIAPAAGLATLGALVVLHLVFRDGVPVLTVYGVVVNALWLWVVKSRGRRGTAPRRDSQNDPNSNI
jgi:hypothetical protein